MFQNAAFKRWFFISVSVIILSLVFWNTFLLFNQLKENERNKMKIWAAAQQKLSSTETSKDIDLILSIIQSNNTTPMIVYSHPDDVYSSNNIDSTRVDNPEKIKLLVTKFSEEYQPIEIKNKDKLFQTIYYGNSPIITKLKYYPVVLLIIIGLFISTLYYIFETSRSAEQNRLWAGMAKETAHQIGTPLSSLLGWTEILKSENVNPEYLKEMSKDIVRLEIIADRFSKVGSIPDLAPLDIVEETKQSFDYLKNRSSKLIEFSIATPDTPIMVNVNKQLYSWTIENLVKNGIDAMKGRGSIHLSMEQSSKNVHIKVTDTGKGLSKKHFKQIFKPGYTTKKRGWGLGLSLAKRIIEEYHKGKIKVCNSTLGEGTTMEIVLKRMG